MSAHSTLPGLGPAPCSLSAPCRTTRMLSRFRWLSRLCRDRPARSLDTLEAILAASPQSPGQHELALVELALKKSLAAELSLLAYSPPHDSLKSLHSTCLILVRG